MSIPKAVIKQFLGQNKITIMANSIEFFYAGKGRFISHIDGFDIPTKRIKVRKFKTKTRNYKSK